MIKYYTLLMFLVSLGSVSVAQNKLEEQLIVFVQSAAESNFTKKNIEGLQQYMQSKSIPIKIVDIQKEGGAPAELGYTPFIVYQNHLGRKIYKGRYTAHNRILNFIRTVRSLGHQLQRYNEPNVFVWKHGRMRLAIKKKVTKPTGAVPEDFDFKAFEQQAQKGLAEGLSKFKFYELAEVSKSDEIFYFNFYSNINDQGQWLVSTELYSHYDCINPIYKQYSNPAKGETIEKAFAHAAKDLQGELIQQLHKSNLGDAMTVVATKFPVKNWEALNLPLPAPPLVASNPVTSVLKELPKSWVYAGAYNKRPVLQFRFPAPLTQYAGELKEIEGAMKLMSSHSFEEAQATFTVSVKSLTMGLESLDKAVKDKMLKLVDFPTASLTFNTIVGDKLEFDIGKICKADVIATLTIMGKKVEVSANTQVEPFVSEKGEPRLYIQTSFDVDDLEGSLGIKGPDGPENAKNRMLFSASFIMKPTD